MIGKKIFKLTAVERLAGSKYRCVCDCGNERIMHVGHFNSGYAKSCGCHVIRHGKSNSREQMSYSNMMARCHNPKNKRYKDYGEKGIFVCDEWRNNFYQFYLDMGDCPSGYQIDRIDNRKGYSKENCRWVDAKTNMNNRSISVTWIVYGKRFQTTIEAAKHFNVSTSTITAWCKGRTAEGRYYKPKEGCSYEKLY